VGPRAVNDDAREAPGAVAFEVVVDGAVAAAVAAHAARGVPGVLRLEPGMSGLLSDIAARARHQVRPGAAGEPAPTEGVVVELDGAAATVHVDLALHPGDAVVDVAHRVQSAVAEAVRRDAGLQVRAVSVSVLHIDTAAAGA